jgi:homoserine kinase
MGRPTEVRVRVPASSANLGPGFDSLGLALGLYDDVEVSVAPDGVEVEVVGEGAGRVPCDDSHLVYRAMQTTWNITGATEDGTAPTGVRMRCRNAIPHSRGLGSSAAAAVAGAVAAVVLAGRDPALERDTLLQVTAGMEGHADNAAASLLGGFVVAWETAGNTAERFHAVRLDAHPGIRPVALVAGTESLTSTTRGLLPDRVPLVDAAFTGSRTALAVLAFTQHPELLMPATEDRLHQGYRRPAYPESADLVDALRSHGIPAAISGAGPTVLALTSDCVIPAGIDLHGFVTMPLPVDAHGARIDVG